MSFGISATNCISYDSVLRLTVEAGEDLSVPLHTLAYLFTSSQQ